MEKKSIWGIVAGSLLILSGCSISTPEIRGVVLDEETKQPVPEAWVHALIAIETKTIQGGVAKSLSVDRPHTRTNEKGEFSIPARKLDPIPFPHGFGKRVDYFTIGAETIDDRMGGLDLKDYEWKRKMEVVIYVKPWEKIVKDKDYLNSHYIDLYSSVWGELEKGNNLKAYHSYLKSLYAYCVNGRFYLEIPIVEGGGDEWELNYVVIKYERFLKVLAKPVTKDQIITYSIAMQKLGYLYKESGNYQKAIEIFRAAWKFDLEHNFTLSASENEARIRELEKTLTKQGK